MISVYERSGDGRNIFDAMKMDIDKRRLIITKNTDYKEFIVQEGLKALGVIVNTSVISIDEFLSLIHI